jgi:predicted GNAT superfamily acetyltransferase
MSSERSEISNAECGSFSKLKFMKYQKIMCFASAGIREKCSLIFYVTMWFVAEKLKRRGPARNLYADWIILLKEQFS